MSRASRRRAEQRRAAAARKRRAPQTPHQAPAPESAATCTPQGGVVAPPTAPLGEVSAADPAHAALANDARLISVGRLAALHDERERLDEEVDLLVDQLAARGVSWGEIGRALGISRQGARQRYG